MHFKYSIKKSCFHLTISAFKLSADFVISKIHKNKLNLLMPLFCLLQDLPRSKKNGWVCFRDMERRIGMFILPNIQ